MTNSNKRKGKYFEDKITKDYQTLFNLSKIECYRSSNSGARTSIEYNGDITFSDPVKYNLITECKFYKDIILDHIFPISQSYIDEWLKQSEVEKNHYINQFNKIPLSIIIAGKPFNRNNHYVIITNDSITLSNISNYLIFRSSKMNRNYTLINYSDITLLFNQFNLI